jgi:hypothetical protein
VTTKRIHPAEDDSASQEHSHGGRLRDDGWAHSTPNSIRRLGRWSALLIFFLEVGYIVVFIVGFADLGNTSEPLPDPYLAIAEVIILVIAPILVALMLAIHECAPQAAKPFTLVALGWMFAAAAFTTVVHVVELTSPDTSTRPRSPATHASSTSSGRQRSTRSTSSRGMCSSGSRCCSPHPPLPAAAMPASFGAA